MDEVIADHRDRAFTAKIAWAKVNKGLNKGEAVS